MPTEAFFSESSDQSRVKTAIVSKYFWAWARVIISTIKKHSPNGKIAYIDLFAGPGRYDDHTRSTPLLILERAIADPDMRDMLVSIFNDADKTKTDSLQAEISQLPGVEKLKYKPVVQNRVVGEDIVRMFETMKHDPTLFFVDPWGYKGLSLRLVNSVLKDWGCDCIFFFNYNRISMGLGNEIVAEHMNALFGEQRANILRTKLWGLAPADRENAIVEELAVALRDMGGKYVLPFGFTNERGSRTSHHLIFVSKAFRGYEIMKQVMAGESSSSPQGVASFRYNPADTRFPLLFDLTRPLDDLAGMLLNKYAGRKLAMRFVYEDHNVGTPFIAKNYKEVLRRLEAEGRVECIPPSDQRKKGTLADHVLVAFPAARR